jgi:hypothetical protein
VKILEFVRSHKISTSVVLKIAYLILLATTVIYIKSVLDVDSFKASEKVVEKPAEKIRVVTVNLLLVERGQTTKSYTAKLRNIDTVEDFLKEVRDKQGFYYEKELYTYGTEILTVFDQIPEKGEKWAVLLNDKDITNRVSDEYLIDDSTYVIKQISL